MDEYFSGSFKDIRWYFVQIEQSFFTIFVRLYASIDQEDDQKQAIMSFLDLTSWIHHQTTTLLTYTLFGTRPSPPCYPRGAILVTGANSVLGSKLCQSLLSRGYIVFGGSSSENMQTSQNGTWIPLILDVTLPLSIERAHQIVSRRLSGQPLIGIVHCAEDTWIGPLESCPLEDLNRVFQINTLGPLQVTRAFMGMLRESQGRVVLLGSAAGWLSAPLNAPFAASKLVFLWLIHIEALESLADSLRVELCQWNISVSLIELGMLELDGLPLGSTDTNVHVSTMDQVMRLPQTLPSPLIKLYAPLISSISQILQDTRPNATGPAIRTLIHALTSARPRTRYIVGWDARAARILRDWVPDRVLDGMYVSLMGKIGEER